MRRAGGSLTPLLGEYLESRQAGTITRASWHAAKDRRAKGNGPGSKDCDLDCNLVRHHWDGTGSARTYEMMSTRRSTFCFFQKRE